MARCFYPVPVRFRFHGDEEIASSWTRAGQHFLDKHVEALGFQGVPTGGKRFDLGNGIIIDVSCTYNEHTVDIYASDYAEYGDEEKVKGCFCSCAVTHGFVEVSPGDTEGDSIDFIPDQSSEYEISVCQKDEFGNGEIVRIKNKTFKPLDFFQHRALKGTNFIDANGDQEKLPDDEREIYALAVDKDITIKNEDGTTEDIHVPLNEIHPCDWDEFRLMSIEFSHDPEDDETITPIQEIEDG